MSKSQLALVSLAFASLPIRADAQERLRKHVDGYGLEAAALADVNGDGIPDYALQRYDPKAWQEVVEVRGGRQGGLIRAIPTPAPAGEDWYFGTSVADLGDVDGDGVNDLLVGAMLAPDPARTLVECGAAYVFAGSDGHLIRSLYGSADHEWFGATVFGLGDVDGDGSVDFLVESRQQPLGPPSFLTVFSGATGAVLYTVTGAAFPARISDHDLDGVRDFAAHDGSASVFSGATGGLIASIPPTTVGFLCGIAELDDIDGDGEPELALGECGAVDPGDGQVRVVSIPNQVTLRTHLNVDSREMFGVQIDSGLDADGDGVRDYLVGASGSVVSSGSASLFSGRTGERLYRFVDRDADSLMGSSVAGLGDLDGDGFGECLVGSPYDVPPGTSQFGADFVFRGNDLWLDAYPKSVAAGATETVAMHGAPNGNPMALFVVDFGGTPAFQLTALGVANSVEAFTVSGTVPSGLAGTTWTLRAYALDANGKLIDSADEVVEFL